MVDLTANMAGPFATMTLADQGADVIKIEPPDGDLIRKIGTGRNGATTFFANLNRGKRSVVVDLRTRDGRDLVLKMIDRADVVVHSFRPDAARRLQLDASKVLAGRPRLIHASISGYGDVGPLSHQPVYDHVVQAVSGMAALQTDRSDDKPRLVRHGIVDKATGYALAQAITAALFDRGRTGRGGSVALSMLDVAIGFLWPDGMMNHTAMEDVDVKAPIADGFRLTATSDGFVSVITATSSQWQGLVEALGITVDGFEPESQRSLSAWVAHARPILSGLSAAARNLTTEDLVARLSEHDVPCAGVVALEDVPRHPQVIAAGTFTESKHPQLGVLRQPRPVPQFNGRRLDDSSAAPALGQDTFAVLNELGISLVEMKRLRSTGVVMLGDDAVEWSALSKH